MSYAFDTFNALADEYHHRLRDFRHDREMQHMVAARRDAAAAVAWALKSGRVSPAVEFELRAHGKTAGGAEHVVTAAEKYLRRHLQQDVPRHLEKLYGRGASIHIAPENIDR